MDAENKILHLKAAAAGVIAIFTALWGWFGWVVLVWVALMLADWLVGSAVAAKEGCWSSAKMREGAWHKGGMLLVVCVALTADWLVGSILGNLPRNYPAIYLLGADRPAGDRLVHHRRAGEPGGTRGGHGGQCAVVADGDAGGRKKRRGCRRRSNHCRGWGQHHAPGIS